MSKRIFARRTAQTEAAAGLDSVLMGISLPSDSTLNNVRIKIQALQQVPVLIGVSQMYAVEGWILPVLDPDAAVSFDTLWDQMVPKDTDVQTLDLDFGTADTTSFFEPGEADWSAVFDVGLRPERIYHKKKLLTYVSGVTSRDPETPFLAEWVAADQFGINITKRYRISQPSVVLFGFASPALDDTTGTIETSLAENEWPRVKYFNTVMEQAMMDALGLVEGTAETPWEEALDLIQRHADPDVFELNPNAFGAGTWRVFAEGMFDHSVQGDLEDIPLTTGR